MEPLVSFEKESSIMERKQSNRENLQAFTIKELNSLLHHSLTERDLQRALEIGTVLEEKHSRKNNEEMVETTRFLNSFIRNLLH